MCSTKRMWCRFAPVALVLYASVLLAEQDASAPEAKKDAKVAAPYVGEVTGDSVYVRSMPDQNWYPTIKLGKGDRVEVHDEQFGWLKIRPPRGSFCYVDKSFIIRDRGDKGIISGDNVYIRAGSSLSEWARKKTCVVTKLSKGAEVKILGEQEDGYYRIAPPDGAFYWISRQFVRKVGSGSLKEKGQERAAAPEPKLEPEAAPKPAKADEKKPEPTVVLSPPEAKPPASAPAPKPAEPAKPAAPADFWQKKLEVVDAVFKATTSKKSYTEQELRDLHKQFVPISQQDQEDVPREYAKIRLQQIEDLVERLAIKARLNEITKTVSKVKEEATAVAATQPGPAGKPVVIKPDYEGKLVRSFAFEGRYRIVDPADGKTLVYLEFPPETGIDPNLFVGRLVKVRIKTKRYDQTARRNIIVPSEVVAAQDEMAPGPEPKPAPPPTTSEVGPPVPAASANQPASVDTPE
ncbi:MAG: hypothetical protein JXQ73_31060 [Phycisphaerae bacterium]|nr:hypothetical protein [Phycisphaerae bacterium]